MKRINSIIKVLDLYGFNNEIQFNIKDIDNGKYSITLYIPENINLGYLLNELEKNNLQVLLEYARGYEEYGIFKLEGDVIIKYNDCERITNEKGYKMFSLVFNECALILEHIPKEIMVWKREINYDTPFSTLFNDESNDKSNDRLVVFTKSELTHILNDETDLPFNKCQRIERLLNSKLSEKNIVDVIYNFEYNE